MVAGGVWLLGGHAWLLWGACMVFSGGACMVAPGRLYGCSGGCVCFFQGGVCGFF